MCRLVIALAKLTKLCISRLETNYCGYGGTGRRVSLRSIWERSCGGSSPLIRTKSIYYLSQLLCSFQLCTRSSFHSYTSFLRFYSNLWYRRLLPTYTTLYRSIVYQISYLLITYVLELSTRLLLNKSCDI